MPTDVIMPQMGESIVEGTITKWLKKPGEKVQRDEPLFEISTDKVDAEIPSPTSGVLQEIRVSEGTTVQVNTVVASIAADGEGAAAAPAKQAAPAARQTPPAERKLETAPTPKGAEPPQATVQSEARPKPAPPEQKEGIQFPQEREEEPVRSSPLVRRIARDNNIDLSQVPGSGLGGRITKQDVLAFLEKGPVAASGAATAQAVAPVAIPGEVVPMTQMRKIIAQRMVESRRTSAHVHNLFEADMTRIVTLRNKHRNSFEQRYGTRLTFMPFFVRAAIIGLQQFPIIN